MKQAILVFLFVYVAALFAQTPPGTVLLDSYAGATDDDKLTAALADVQTKTYIPAIMLSGRTYVFAKTRTVFSGLKIVGPPAGYFNSELAGGKYNSVKVQLNVGTGASSWLVGTATTYDVFISHIGFTAGNANCQFYHHPLSAGTLYASAFDTLGFYGFKYVFGDGTDKAALTQVNFVGQWTVLVPRATQFYIGGSDNEFWTAGYLNIGSAPGYPGNGQYLLRFDSVGKTNVGPIYVTAAYGWSGIEVSGDPKWGAVALKFDGARFEGQNKDTPSNGALVVQKGGKVIYRNCWVGYGMKSPASNTAHTTLDQGMIMHLGGEALWDGLSYDRATGVTQDVPILWANAGKVRVFNVFTGIMGGSWTALPKVKNGGAAAIKADDTVTVV